MKICVEEAAVIVSASKEPKTVCTVTFTSPVMRDENTGATEGGNDGNVASTNPLCLSLSLATHKAFLRNIHESMYEVLKSVSFSAQFLLLVLLLEPEDATRIKTG